MDEKILLIKKVTHIVLNNADEYKAKFAEELSKNKFKVQKAYQKAYQNINKIRASNLLQDPAVWEMYFLNLKKRKDLSYDEKLHVEAYDKIIDSFKLSPFDLYIYYVENHKQVNAPIASLISSDSVHNIQVLLFLYDFFTKIERNHFKKQIKARIIEEKAYIDDTGKRDPKILCNFDNIKRMCGKNRIFIETILKENNGK